MKYQRTPPGTVDADASVCPQGTSSPRAPQRARVVSSNRSGQSLVEACLAIGVICLVFMGLLQISQLFAAKEILHHSAARAARARTVGFDRWMIEKAAKVAAIPNAGRMLEPAFVNEDPLIRDMVATMNAGEIWDAAAYEERPTGLQYEIERARIPEYMGAVNRAQANYILNYEDWDSLVPYLPAGTDPAGDVFTMRVRQNVRLWVPFHQAFYADDYVTMIGESKIEHHAGAYIDDQGW